MKTYTVSFKYEAWKHYTIDATDADEAENQAYELLQGDNGDCFNYGEWSDSIVEEL
jgi:hypothetical protein